MPTQHLSQDISHFIGTKETETQGNVTPESKKLYAGVNLFAVTVWEESKK